MRAGSRSLHLHGITIVDDGVSGRATLSTSPGWFFLRLLVQIASHQKDDLASHGVVFTPQRLIQPGWFKVYLNDEQLAYLRSHSDLVSLLPVKQHVHPNFAELQGAASFSVQAADDWSPAAPIAARRIGTELFVVRGASAEEIWSDPHVASITRSPKVHLHGD
jgi:hypothetical protein